MGRIKKECCFGKQQGKNMQFPVKWNAFSDRNGMLFSGLTEWLSDTNGMAQ